MNYSSKFITLRNNSPFSKRRQSEFKLKWNKTSFNIIGSVPAVPTFKLIGKLYQKVCILKLMPAQKGFASILIIVGVILLAVIGGGVFFLKPQSEPRTYPSLSSLPPQQNQILDTGNQFLYHHAYITFSQDGKTWKEAGHISLSEKSNKGGAVDPSIVQLEDGTLRLYFFGSEITSGDPAKHPGKHKVYSAKSSNGVNFIIEGVSFEDEKLTDPEVIYFQNKYFMYYSVGATIKLATSSDGLKFTAVNITGGDVGGVPGALALDNNGIRLFGCKGGIQMAFASNGINFKPDGMIDIKACDPAAVKLSDGRYALLYKIDENMKKPGGMQPMQPPQPGQ